MNRVWRSVRKRDPDGIAWSLYDLGHLAFVQGGLAHAERLLVESLTLMRGQGSEHGVIRAQLDEATFAAAWAEGRQMTLEQAIAEALEPLKD